MSVAEAMEAWTNVAEADRRLRLKPRVGSVVEHPDGDRGIVIPLSAMGPLPLYETDFAIRLGPGHTRVSNDVDRWRVVPEGEQTAAERVRSVIESWRPEEGDDSYAWHLLAALLPPADLEERTDLGMCDWPDEADLALAVAALIDPSTTDQGRADG